MLRDDIQAASDALEAARTERDLASAEGHGDVQALVVALRAVRLEHDKAIQQAAADHDLLVSAALQSRSERLSALATDIQQQTRQLSQEQGELQVGALRYR